MSRFIKIVTLAVLFLINLTGCISKQVPQHPENITVDDLNISIQLFAPKAWNNFKINKPVSLEIINISDKDIEFASDLDKEIFLVQGDQLVKIEDVMQKIDVTVALFDGTLIINDDILVAGESMGFVFKVLLENKTSFVRVYVKGKYEDTEEPVAGYLDIKLNP